MSGRTALILIDCQNDFLDRAGLTPPRDILLQNISAALADARVQRLAIFHVRTSAGHHGCDAMPHRQGCAEVIDGTPGSATPAIVEESGGEPVFTKRFFSAFDAAGLAEALVDAGISDLRLVGVHTHACIQASALEAYSRGFRVEIDPKLVGSDRPELAEMALGWMNGRVAEVVSPRDAATYIHRQPADPSVILFEVADHDPAAIAAAIERIRQAQPTLQSLSLADRRARLEQLHARISRDRDDFTEALIRDVGKPRRDAEGEVGYGLALLKAVSATLDDTERHTDRVVRYRPLGVTGLITPWNNPFAIPLGKIAPAVGYGNGILWKPAPAGSGIAAMLVDRLASVGLGEFVECIDGSATTGRALVAAEGIDAISFTGSASVGREIIAEGGRRAIPVQAELGGSNAAILDAGADLSAAAQDLATAIFSFAGQRCTAIRRIIVAKEVYDAFTAQLATAVEQLRLTDPTDAASDMGPMIDSAARSRIANLVDSAIAQGARLITGGSRTFPDRHNGSWHRPTIIADIPADHPLLTEEAFGPVALLLRATTFDEALAAHNATGFGLVGVLYSTDDAHMRKFLEGAEAGLLSINRARPAFSADGPFLGWKNSGYGVAEHGRWNRDFYTRPQVVY